MPLFSACPRDIRATTPILFVHHGRSRNARDYRDYLMDLVDAHDLLVIALEFSDAHFPGQPWYNAGNVMAASGGLNPHAHRSYTIVEHLFADLADQGVTTQPGYGLFGHSAGSQFVHRMVMLGHRDRVVACVPANAGTYLMPDLDIDFPYGLRGTGADATALPGMLAAPLTVMAGTADTNPDEPFFPNDLGSMRQGATRYERAHRFVAAGYAAAATLGVPCAWTIIDVPDVAHDGRRMAQAAAPVLAAALHAAARAVRP